MNTCGTCKYKGTPILKYDNETFSDLPTAYFRCDRAEHVETRYEDASPGKKMFVEDGSGYYAALCVEDDFGCNQWEAK
jgi:hypothetical protein